MLPGAGEEVQQAAPPLCPRPPSALPAACSYDRRQMLFDLDLLRDAGRLTPRALTEILWWPAPEVLWPHSSFLTHTTPHGARFPPLAPGALSTLGLLATWVPFTSVPLPGPSVIPPSSFLLQMELCEWSEPSWVAQVQECPRGGHFPSCVTASKECHLSESESSPLG